MKRLLIMSFMSLMLISVSAQRYDYDDIYFNPKTDLREEVKNTVEEKSSDASTAVVTTGGMSYTDRINAFHRSDSAEQDPLAHIADPNYTTNVFMLSDGQYVVNVDGDDVYIAENYNYPWSDWSFWNRSPWYFGYSYGWYGYGNPWYDPWFDPYWGYYPYNPYYPGYYPSYGYYPGYYPGCYPATGWYDPGFYYPSLSGGLYASSSSENNRRGTNSATRFMSGMNSSNRGSSVARNSQNSTSRGSSASVPRYSTNRGGVTPSHGTSTSRGTSTVRATSTYRNGNSVSRNTSFRQNYLPARPTSMPRNNSLQTTSYETYNRSNGSTTNRSSYRTTSPNRSSRSTTYSVPRSSGGSRSTGFGGGGGSRSSGGGNSTRRGR